MYWRVLLRMKNVLLFIVLGLFSVSCDINIMGIEEEDYDQYGWNPDTYYPCESFCDSWECIDEGGSYDGGFFNDLDYCLTRCGEGDCIEVED